MLLARPQATSEEGEVVDVPELSVPELVHAALEGRQWAWNDLVRRFTPLLLSVTARYRLAPTDAADVSQTVWLQLVQHLSDVREPGALPGWIATSVRHECIRLLRAQQRVTATDPQDDRSPWEADRGHAGNGATDEELLRQERHEALLAGFAELTARQRELLLLLLADPPLSYAEISLRLGMPVGAIGPTRARAVERLRHSPALAALLPNGPVAAEVK